MKIQERMGREKNYHMKFIFVCMAFMTNVCLNWRNISFYHRNVKNKYVFQFLDVYSVICQGSEANVSHKMKLVTKILSVCLNGLYCSYTLNITFQNFSFMLCKVEWELYV